MQVVNLTPHPITYENSEGVRIVFETSGTIARIDQSDPVPLEGENFPFRVVEHPSWGEVENLPPYKEGTMLIVSSLVLAHCVGRDDVFAPATGPAHGCIRNMRGHIQAVTAFIAAPGA